MTSSGTAKKRMNGRNLPQRVMVRSTARPAIRSAKASQSRTTKNIVPTAAALQAGDVGVVVEKECRAEREGQVAAEIAEAVPDEGGDFQGAERRLLLLRNRCGHRVLSSLRELLSWGRSVN